MTRFDCCDETRRARVAAHPTLNGIDWLDVLDRDTPPGLPRQQFLLVHLIKPVPADPLPTVRIEGLPGVQIAAVARLADVPELVSMAIVEANNVLAIRTDRPGLTDHVLRLQRDEDDARAPLGYDPRLATIAFSFKIDCDGERDCSPPGCDGSELPTPAVAFDTLARDYAGFRRLLLDRMRALLPGWTTGNPADLGVTLAELIAYAGDQLAWKQDAVAAEAYLSTARRRISLRRHALLVDYRIDEGRAAEAWVQIRLADGVPAGDVPLASVQFATKGEAAEWFEPIDAAGRNALDPALGSVRLDPDHHAMPLYDWGDVGCCLPAGATGATLLGHYPALSAGDWLILEEILDPVSGLAENADPARRHAVQLTEVQATDEDGEPLLDPLPDPPVQITEVRWKAPDALPFGLCLGAASMPGVPVAMARGNLVRSIHGKTVTNVPLPAVPEPRFMLPVERMDRCDPAEPAPFPPRYRPMLSQGPVVHERDADGVARAALFLTDEDGERWTAHPDLLLSGPDDRHLVAEMEEDGRAVLRFGDGRFGCRPLTGARFRATYRIGGGPAGNVGADTILRVVTDDPRLDGARNPLPAQGGTAPETAAQIRRRAPTAFRRQERAVTLADWEHAAARLPGIARGAARSRWTGSWRTTALALDHVGGEPGNAEDRRSNLASLEKLRMAGRDLTIEDAVSVPILLSLLVCVEDGALRPTVARDLTRALGSSLGADGRPALFHPDRLSFGQNLLLSPVLAAARSVSGVASVEITRFVRADAPDDALPLATGRLRLGPREIAHLGAPVLLDLHGGR